MLSNSYNVDVTYTDKFRNGEMIVESWFVKVPLSQKTFLLDEMEVFMYDRMIPMLQAFAAKACINENDVGGFHLHLLEFPFICQFYSRTRTAVSCHCLESLF